MPRKKAITRRKTRKIKEWAAFTDLEKAFVEEYVTNGMNATRAYLVASGTDSEHYASKRGSIVSRKEHIVREVNRRLATGMMSENEALARHAIAGRADIGDILVDHEVVCPKCRYILHNQGVMRPDLSKARALGMSHLIKKITNSADGRLQTVEFYPSDEARRDIMRAHGTFQTKAEESVGGLADLLSAALKAKAARSATKELEGGADASLDV